MEFRSLITIIEEAGSARDTAFNKLADDQRGDPELAMLSVQRANVGGVLSYVVEHVGDLTHRMAQYPNKPDYFCGYELVKPKVNRSYGILTSGYGFAREHEQNIASNAEYKGVTVEVFKAHLADSLSIYAAEHSKLQVFNQAQYLAREAAVLLGKQKWKQSADCLYQLSLHLDSPEQWVEFAGGYDPAFSQKPL